MRAINQTIEDATRQLAKDRLDIVGVSWGQLTTVGQAAALKGALDQINSLPNSAVEILAERWNEPDPLDAQRDLLIAAIGYEPVDLSIDGHPDIRKSFRTITDRDGLIERILAAGFRAEVKS